MGLLLFSFHTLGLTPIIYTHFLPHTGNSGIGLEMAVALCEAGANIYVVDLAANPSDTFLAAQKYVEALGNKLHYIQGDVTNQQQMWDIGEKIGDAEGRLDCCVAAAGILRASPVGFFCALFVFHC